MKIMMTKITTLKKIFLTIILFVLSTNLYSQNSFPAYAKAEDAGISTERLNRIDTFINGLIENEYLPGAVVFIARHGKVVYHKAYGYDDIETKSLLRKDDIFRIASQTKAITSIAAMMLFEEGKFLLDDPISNYIPEFKNTNIIKTFNEQDTTCVTEPAKRGITVRQLLTHTSGIGYATIGTRQMNAIYAKAGVPSGVGNITGTLAEKMKLLAGCPIQHEPGEKFTYGLNSDLLGYLVEIWSGMSLDQFFKTRIFEPLGMNDTYFYLPKEKQHRLVKLYEERNGVAKKINKSVEGDADYPCMEGTYFSGGAGLSSTIEDYAKFLQMLLNGGTFNGNRLLSRKTIDLIITNQLSDEVSKTRKFGLGFEIETPERDHLTPLTVGSFSWAGMFNTSYWADPKENIVALIYSQIYPTTTGRIEHKFRALVYQAVIE